MILTSLLGLERTAQMNPEEFTRIEEIVNHELATNPVIDAELSRNPAILKELAAAVGRAVQSAPYKDKQDGGSKRGKT